MTYQSAASSSDEQYPDLMAAADIPLKGLQLYNHGLVMVILFCGLPQFQSFLKLMLLQMSAVALEIIHERMYDNVIRYIYIYNLYYPIIASSYYYNKVLVCSSHIYTECQVS